MPLAVTASELRGRVTAYLAGNRPAILAAAEHQLAGRPSRYTQDGPEAARARLGLLFDRLLEAVTAGDLRPLIEHADVVADARFHSGFRLGDVQAAYNALEEAIWAEVFASGDTERNMFVLPIVSMALGAAKDVVARDYVALAAGVHAQSVDVTALFRGLERP